MNKCLCCVFMSFFDIVEPRECRRKISFEQMTHNAVVFVGIFLQTPRHVDPFTVRVPSACFRTVGHASFGSTIRDGVYNVLECFGVFFVGEF